jgi:hypothetical protein
MENRRERKSILNFLLIKLVIVTFDILGLKEKKNDISEFQLIILLQSINSRWYELIYINFPRNPCVADIGSVIYPASKPPPPCLPHTFIEREHDAVMKSLDSVLD